MPELTDEQLEELVRRKVQEHLSRNRTYEEILRDRVEEAFGLTRDSKLNNVVDRMKVMRMTPEEREVHLIDRELASEATEQLHEIEMARKEVRKAKLRRKPVDPEIAELAATDVDSIKVECIVPQTHVGDGRVLHKGDTAHVHEHFAEILERAGHVRIRRPRAKPKSKSKTVPDTKKGDTGSEADAVG